MTTTSTLTHRGIEGNRRVHYGYITATSTDVVIRSLNTGLRMVESLEARSLISGGLAIVSYPLTLPALNSISGHFTIDFTTPESGAVYWVAKGKM